MKQNRLPALLLAVLLLALPLAGCTAPAPSSAPASSILAQSEEAAFPVTLTDALGREVTINEQPQVLVSGYYITSSLLIALGLEDNVAGLEAKAASRPIYALSAPRMLELPNVGTAKEFDLEGCAALKPDLVILPVKLKESAEALTELGITVLTVNPENGDLLAKTIEMIGKATGTTARAEALLGFIEEKYSTLSEKVSAEAAPTVYLGGNSDLLSTAGQKMYQNAVIEAAGGKNVAAELEDNYWTEISYEQLIAWNPDVIVLAPGAAYTVEEVLGDANLAELTAVANGAVYRMPDALEAWDSPVPSSVLGSLWMASVLHPEQYSAEEFAADVTAYYQEFYALDVDSALLKQS